MPSTSHSESIRYSSRRENSSHRENSGHRESSGHRSTGPYFRQTTTHYVRTSTSSTVTLTGSRPGSDSSARAISHRSHHDDRRDRSPRHEGSSITHHDYNRASSRNISIRTQISSGTRHRTDRPTHRHEQNPQRPAASSQMERFAYHTNSIQDVLIRRQYGFQGSDRQGNAARRISEFDAKYNRHQ